MQQGNNIGKWEKRSRIGMYLGSSPTHARSVQLILSIKTGLVSIQFHVKFDDFYETTKWEKFMPKSEWQYNARILIKRPSNTPDLDSDTIMRLLLNKQINYKPSSTIDQGATILTLYHRTMRMMNRCHQTIMKRRMSKTAQTWQIIMRRSKATQPI